MPNSVLISNMEARIHTGELKVADVLIEAGPLKEELFDFQRHVSDSGRATWGARVGKHDDIILSVSLAMFWAVRTSNAISTTGAMSYYEFQKWRNPDNQCGGLPPPPLF